jgi:hypothetical protein
VLDVVVADTWWTVEWDIWTGLKTYSYYFHRANPTNSRAPAPLHPRDCPPQQPALRLPPRRARDAQQGGRHRRRHESAHRPNPSALFLPQQSRVAQPGREPPLWPCSRCSLQARRAGWPPFQSNLVWQLLRHRRVGMRNADQRRRRAGREAQLHFGLSQPKASSGVCSIPEPAKDVPEGGKHSGVMPSRSYHAHERCAAEGSVEDHQGLLQLRDVRYPALVRRHVRPCNDAPPVPIAGTWLYMLSSCIIINYFFEATLLIILYHACVGVLLVVICCLFVCITCYWHILYITCHLLVYVCMSYNFLLATQSIWDCRW